VKEPQDGAALFQYDGTALGDTRTLERFITELLILDLDGIYGNENIVKLEGIGWYHSPFAQKPTIQPRIVLEHAEATLADFTSNDVSWDFKIGACLSIARGLAALHDCDIIHGDLTLRNVLVFRSQSPTDATIPDYKAKITDFSHSFVPTTHIRKMRGTKGYEPPEVTEDKAIDNPKTVDIYALGVCLWKILVSTNVPSFDEPIVDLPEDTTDIHTLLEAVHVAH
jgi:serine/threonine protein kinase